MNARGNKGGYGSTISVSSTISSVSSFFTVVQLEGKIRCQFSFPPSEIRLTPPIRRPRARRIVRQAFLEPPDFPIGAKFASRNVTPPILKALVDSGCDRWVSVEVSTARTPSAPRSTRRERAGGER